MSHPSFLQRDRALLRGEAPHCSDCAPQHSTPPMPRALMERALTRRRLWPQLALVAALAVGVVMVLPPATTSKGGSSVSVYVKRGNETNLWSPERPLRTGDRIQLVVDSKASRITVMDTTGTHLYDGALSAGPTSLPLSWRVEGAGSEERLTVVLGDERIELVLPKEPQ